MELLQHIPDPETMMGIIAGFFGVLTGIVCMALQPKPQAIRLAQRTNRK